MKRLWLFTLYFNLIVFGLNASAGNWFAATGAALCVLICMWSLCAIHERKK